MERLLNHPVSRATRIDEAEDSVTRVFLPHQIAPADRETPLDMRLNAVRLGSLTAAYLAYGQEVDMRTTNAFAYHFNMPVQGRARSSFGRVSVDAGLAETVAYLPDEPASIKWSADCAQLCLMVERVTLEQRLAAMLGRPVSRIGFAPAPQLGVLDVLAPFLREFEGPALLRRHPLAASTLEQLVLDGLLLTLRHDHHAELERAHHIPRGPVCEAVELLEERPHEAWTTTTLAAAVAVSARALQAGFRTRLLRRLDRLRRRRQPPQHHQVRTHDDPDGQSHAVRPGRHTPRPRHRRHDRPHPGPASDTRTGRR